MPLSPGVWAAGPRLVPAPSGCADTLHAPHAWHCSQQDKAAPALSCSSCRQQCATAACPAWTADSWVAIPHLPHPPLAQYGLASTLQGTASHKSPWSATRRRAPRSTLRGTQHCYGGGRTRGPLDRGGGGQGVGDVRAGQQKLSCSTQPPALTGARDCPQCPLGLTCTFRPPPRSPVHPRAEAASSAADGDRALATGSGGAPPPLPTMPHPRPSGPTATALPPSSPLVALLAAGG